MRLWLACAALALVAAALAAHAAKLPDSLPTLVNSVFLRTVDLTMPSARESFSVSVKNEDSKATADAYYFLLDARAAKELAFVEAWTRQNKRPLAVERDEQHSDR